MFQGRNHGFKVRGPSAESASRGAKGAEGGGVFGGVLPPPTGGSGRGPCPLSRNVFDFLSENGEFWCILGGASALYVATAQESEA